MMNRIISVIIAALALCTACVKENRSACPCLLRLDFRDVDPVKFAEAKVVVSSADGVVFSGVVDSSVFDKEFDVEVPRRKLWVNVYGGECDGVDLVHGGLKIGRGASAPKIYMHSNQVDADCEMLTEKVALCKNHCVITIAVKGMPASPFKFLVRGNINAYGIDGRPGRGDFVYELQPDGSGSAEAVVFRQLDASLLLDIEDVTEIVKTFALGEYVVSSGYDWSSKELKDIVIEIDYARSRIVVTVSGWTEEYVFDVEI